MVHGIAVIVLYIIPTGTILGLTLAHHAQRGWSPPALLAYALGGAFILTIALGCTLDAIGWL